MIWDNIRLLAMDARIAAHGKSMSRSQQRSLMSYNPNRAEKSMVTRSIPEIEAHEARVHEEARKTANAKGAYHSRFIRQLNKLQREKDHARFASKPATDASSSGTTLTPVESHTSRKRYEVHHAGQHLGHVQTHDQAQYNRGMTGGRRLSTGGNVTRWMASPHQEPGQEYRSSSFGHASRKDAVNSLKRMHGIARDAQAKDAGNPRVKYHDSMLKHHQKMYAFVTGPHGKEYAAQVGPHRNAAIAHYEAMHAHLTKAPDRMQRTKHADSMSYTAQVKGNRKAQDGFFSDFNEMNHRLKNYSTPRIKSLRPVRSKTQRRKRV